MEESFKHKLYNFGGPPLLLDGSMGRYLEEEYEIKRDTLTWMLKALLDEDLHPTVIEAHQDYIAAGSDVITTFNYAAVPIFLNNIDCLEEMGRLNELAATLARKAIETYNFEERVEKPRKIWIAGALPTPG